MADGYLLSGFFFRFMALIHDNPLRRVLDNPVKTLEAADIQPGQQVLEVGCGPGFFTIAAAKLVGDNGCVHAIDLQPLAIKTVEKKLKRTGLANVTVRIADAAETGLPSETIDVVLLFGVIHRLELPTVLPELHRVLRPGGALAVRTFSRGSLARVTNAGLFASSGKEGRVVRFHKKTDSSPQNSGPT